MGEHEFRVIRAHSLGA